MILSELLMWWMDVWLVDKSILWYTIWNIQQVYFWINLLQVDRAFMYKKPIEHNVDAITRSMLYRMMVVLLLQWWCHILPTSGGKVASSWSKFQDPLRIFKSQSWRYTGLDLGRGERKPFCDLTFDGSRQTANYHISSMLPRLLVNREAVPSTKASPCLPYC